MSAWRRIAIEKLPKYRSLIEASESLGRLWVDLWLKFVEAHRAPIDESAVRGVYEFAKWCLACSGNEDISAATICHFYEHLPTVPLVRQELPKHMSRQDFLGLEQVFEYHLTPEEHAHFVSKFLEDKKRLL